MGSDTDGLLINNPLALVDKIFGPERQFDGHWMQFHEAAAPMYVDEAVIEQEEDEDALGFEGELCPQEE